MSMLFEDLLLPSLEDFKPKESQPVRSARRPAGDHILIETRTTEPALGPYTSMVDFWLHALHGFLQDSGSKVEWFEGLAYQAQFRSLEPAQFSQAYQQVAEQLILPPPNLPEISEAHLLLNGRVKSFMGVDEDGLYWAATFGPCYFSDLTPY